MTRENTGYPIRETRTDADGKVWNWAQNATLGDKNAVSAPETEAELQALVASSQGKIRMMGSKMSPGRMIELAERGDTLLDMSRLRGLLAITDDSATFAGGTPLHEVYEILSGVGRMLPASPGVIASQSLAGALATGTLTEIINPNRISIY